MTIEDFQAEFDQVHEEPTLVDRVGRRARRYVYAAIGAVAVGVEKATELRRETIEPGIDRLAERGQQVKENTVQAVGEGAQAGRQLATGMGRQVTNRAGAAVGSVTGKVRDQIGIASAEDVEIVIEQLDSINDELDTMTPPPVA